LGGFRRSPDLVGRSIDLFEAGIDRVQSQLARREEKKSDTYVAKG
jgi:hypothetical protein